MCKLCLTAISNGDSTSAFINHLHSCHERIIKNNPEALHAATASKKMRKVQNIKKRKGKEVENENWPIDLKKSVRWIKLKIINQKKLKKRRQI